MSVSINIVANHAFLNRVRSIPNFKVDLGMNLKGSIPDPNKRSNRNNEITIKDVFIEYYVNNFRKLIYKNGVYNTITFYQCNDMEYNNVQFFINDWKQMVETTFDENQDVVNFILGVVKSVLEPGNEDDATLRISCKEVDKYKCPDISNPDSKEYTKQMAEWRRNMNNVGDDNE